MPIGIFNVNLIAGFIAFNIEYRKYRHNGEPGLHNRLYHLNLIKIIVEFTNHFRRQMPTRTNPEPMIIQGSQLWDT